MHAHIHSCSNGLQALLHTQGEAALVSLQFWVQSGSIHEGKHLGAGLSHLLEHMVFKGSINYTGAQLAQRVQELGGSWNAYTSTDRTVYHIDGPAEHWQQYLELLTELVFKPSFPQEDWDRERDVIRREMAMYNDDPQDAAYRALNETLFLAHPRRLPVIGHPEYFDALSYEDMLEYHRANYIPNKVFICCSSGADCITAADFSQAVDEACGPLKAGGRQAEPCPQEPMQWGPRQCRREFAQATSTLMLAWRTPAANHPDAAPLALLASMLGDGRSAWLHSYFHDELGLAHDVSTALIPTREGEGQGAFLIEADCERERRDELCQALLDYIEQLPQHPDFEQGLQRALRQLKVRKLKGLASVQGRANHLATSWHLSRNPQLMEEWSAALEAVTPQQLQETARKYLGKQQLCTISIDPQGSNSTQKQEDKNASKAKHSEHQLSNGLKIVLYSKAQLPMVHSTIAFGAGCGTENAQNAGINTLLAECMLKGTDSRNARQIANTLENLGASIDSDAGNNTLTLSTNALSDDLGTMIEILADCCIKPSLPEESIEQEKEAMLAELLDSLEDPLALAFRHQRTACFGEQGYGLSPDGTETSIKQLNKTQLQEQHQRICCGANGVISLVGDFDEKEALQLLEQHFGQMPQGQPIQRSQTPEQQSNDIHLESDKQQAIITVAMPVWGVESNKLVHMSLLLEWCKDMAGPLFTEIREKRGLAYFVSATSFCGIGKGVLYFYLGTSEEQAQEARQALTNCLQSMGQQGMSEEEFKRTKATAMAGVMMNIQSDKRISSAMAVDTLLGLDSEHVIKTAELMEQIQYEEMQEIIAETLGQDRTRTWVSVGGEK